MSLGAKLLCLRRSQKPTLRRGISGSISRGVEKTADTKGVDEQVISWGLVPREQGTEVSTYHLPSALLERLRCRQRVRPNVRHKMVPGDLEKAGAGM